MKITNIEQYLSTFEKSTKNPTLETMYWLMNKFGNPHKNLKFVHIAGTNGKGSIAEMLASIFLKQNIKFGKFMSPYLIKFNEDISVNNVNISNFDALLLLNELDEKVQEFNNTHNAKVTWFELVTSLAILYFSRQNCQIVILETGLGGLYDCTNIVTPLISIITSIGYDHMSVLGNTLEEIAMQKAGIIKENSHTIFVKQEDNINNLIESVCKNRNNNLHFVDKNDITNFSYNSDYQCFDYKNFTNLKINLKGLPQLTNAAMCIEACDILKQYGFKFSEDSIRNGLKKVIHRARFEKLQSNHTIIFEGGHNENAIKHFINTVNMYEKNNPKVFILSILKTKDYHSILELLINCFPDSTFIFTSGNDISRYNSKEDLYNDAIKIDSNLNCYAKELEEAINFSKINYKNSTIFVLGSFYVYSTVINILK